MRGLSFFLGSALLLVSGPGSLFAQHGGGHSSPGHLSVSGGGHTHGAPASTFASSSLSNRNLLPGQLIYPTPIGLQRQYSGYTGINLGVLPTGNRRTYGFGGNRYGYGYGPYIPYYLSTFDDSYDYSTPWQQYPSGYDSSEQTGNVTANLLGQQIAQLSAQVDELKGERQSPYQGPVVRPPYNAPPALPQPAPAQDDTPASAPLTLVLTSGKQMQIKSYAVMGQTIWDFSVQPAKRIMLSTINIDASQTATEAAGGEFPELH